jgi:hypothetical protein
LPHDPQRSLAALVPPARPESLTRFVRTWSIAPLLLRVGPCRSSRSSRLAAAGSLPPSPGARRVLAAWFCLAMGMAGPLPLVGCGDDVRCPQGSSGDPCRPDGPSGLPPTPANPSGADVTSADLSAPAEDAALTPDEGQNADLSPEDLIIDPEDGAAPEDARPADGDPTGPVDGDPGDADAPPDTAEDTAVDTAAAPPLPPRARLLTMTPNTCSLGFLAAASAGGLPRLARAGSSRVHGRIGGDLGRPHRAAPRLGEAHRT